MIENKLSRNYSLLLIVILVFVTYCNTLSHGFLGDDAQVIVDNAQIKSLANLPALFTGGEGLEGATGFYRPLAQLSFALEHAVYGANPVGYNVDNLLLHLGVALALFLLVERLFGSRRLALCSALLFALHPVAGETVNLHAGGRDTLLCALFGLLALLSHDRNKRLPALLFVAVAIFSGELGLLFPLFMYASDRFLKKERRPFGYYAFYLIPLAGYFAVRALLVKGSLSTAHALSERLLAAPALAAGYLGHLLYPFNQKVLYDSHPTAIGAALGAVLVLALMAASWLFRKSPELSAALCWLLAFLLPVLGLLPLPAGALMADRFSYLALMGFALLLAYLLGKLPAKGALALLVLCCAGYAAVDVQRNGYFADDLALSSRMIKDAPAMAHGYYNAGIYYSRKGNLDEAQRYLLLANGKQDVTPPMLAGASSVLWEAQRLDAAEQVLQHQLQVDAGNPQPLMTLKMLYAKEGKTDQARSLGDKAAKQFPGIEKAMVKRTVDLCTQAEGFLTMRSFDEAEKLLREALIINPDFVPALVDMGNLSAEKGNNEQSVGYFTKALALDPLNQSAHFNLAQVYQAQGKTAEAGAEMAKFQKVQAQAKGAAEQEQTPPAPPAAKPGL